MLANRRHSVGQERGSLGDVLPVGEKVAEARVGGEHHEHFGLSHGGMRGGLQQCSQGWSSFPAAARRAKPSSLHALRSASPSKVHDDDDDDEDDGALGFSERSFSLRRRTLTLSR